VLHARSVGFCAIRSAPFPRTGRIAETSRAGKYYLAGRDDRRLSVLFFHRADFVPGRDAAHLRSGLVEAASRRDDLSPADVSPAGFPFEGENSSLTKGRANSKIGVCLYRER